MILLGLEAADEVLAIVKLHQNHQHNVAAKDSAKVVAAILPACGLGSNVTYKEHMVALAVDTTRRASGWGCNATELLVEQLFYAWDNRLVFQLPIKVSFFIKALD